jgi:hypothetical protein
MRDKSKSDFAALIEKNEWLNLLYSGDWEHNERLQFVRMFYNKEQRVQKVKTSGLKTDKLGQIKLL